MSSVLMFLLADAVFLGAFLFLVVAAFRVRVLYGFLVLFLPLAPLVFAIKYPKEGGVRFVVTIVAFLAMVFIAASSPELKTHVGKRLPGVTLLAEALGTKDAPVHGRGPAYNGGTQAPREARDIAENEVPPAAARPAAVRVDPHAAQRAALAQHSAELNARYAELNQERATLKKGSSGVALFNIEVARYQQDVKALTAEQAQLDALDHPAAASAAQAQAASPPPAAASDPKEAAANAALLQLRAAAAQGDYPAFTATLKKCLADYRGTTSFPQIAATARPTLANATPDRLAAALQGQGAAAHSEMEAAMGRVRGIVNQTPPTVPKPPAGAEVYHYAYHPGAMTPDYAHADLLSTRELWKGQYVYMEAAPNVYYRSADCEFNPQTKFFFTSRDVPKKRLTDAEVAEVVRLYRAIAADERTLEALPQRVRDAQAASAELLALNQQLTASR